MLTSETKTVSHNIDGCERLINRGTRATKPLPKARNANGRTNAAPHHTLNRHSPISGLSNRLLLMKSLLR